MRMTLAKKLIFGFMGLLILMIIISIIAYSNLQKVAKSSDVILFDEVPISDAGMNSLIALISARDAMGEYLLCNDISQLDQIEKDFDGFVVDFDMYVNAMIYGSESEEFKSAEGGSIHDMWVKDGLEGSVVVKKSHDEIIKLAKEANDFHAKLVENAKEMMAHHKKALEKQAVILIDEEKAARESMAQLDKWGQEADLKMKEIDKASGINMDKAMTNGDKAVSLANLLIIGISVFSVLLGILIAFTITTGVLKQLGKDPAIIVDIINRISAGDLSIDFSKEKKIVGAYASVEKMIKALKYKAGVLETIADGDLTVEVELASNNDGLGKSLLKMNESLNDALAQVNGAVEQTASGSNQVAQASQSLSQGATEQASSLEEITSSITEISSQAKQNADNAIQASGLAKQAMENAENGNKQMQYLVTAMGDINKSADMIKKIVKVIDDIAFQTNLLALNANVEAARAGKYGKGFAVVAEEVRNLAGRSATSVQETTQMVEEAIKNIDTGNKLVDATAKQLAEIMGSSSKVADLVEEIATASKEQTQGLDQINQVTQSNTASAEESASAAEELASQSQQLKAIIGRFKLKDAGDITMIGDERISSELMKKVRAEIEKTQIKSSHLAKIKEINSKKNTETKKGSTVSPKDIIKLDDDDFGKFSFPSIPLW